ncbi:helix-turn-helix domain-containing protein [Paenibacillus xanthanilyticus]|uniref:Helix-turn-helix domain-containing protein n=1 Tax=Paenibacillus xanthanilyticus TaxID=1783531 RepID=A0ABV8K6C3_9BACL
MTYFKSKLFLNYIWSYLFILLLPLICLTALIYHNALSNLRSEIEQSRLAQLSQAKVVIDGRMKELGEIASRISYDKRLTPYRVRDPITSGEAIAALDQYKATSSIIGEIYLYFHQDHKIYSSKGLNDYEVFAHHTSFRNWDKDTLFENLNSVKYPTMRPADIVSKPNGRQESMLAYLNPITPNNPNPHGTVMYLIQEAELAGLIDTILGNYQGLAYILDNEGRVLIDNHQGEALDSAEESALFAALPQGITERSLNGKAHSIVSVKSDMNGWTYVTAMPSAQFFGSVLHVRSIILMLFTLVVIAGAGIALFMARMQYRPISKLVDLASSRAKPNRKPDARPPAGNELERIGTALREYSSRVDLQEPFARNHVLSLLLKHGHAQSLTPELQEALNLRFDRGRHVVLVIGWEHTDPDRIKTRRQLTKLLDQLELPALSAHGYGVELPQLDQLGLIVSFDPTPDADEFAPLQQIAEAVRDRLLASFEVVPIIGVGNSYDSPDQINQSYIEACSAFELRQEPGVGAITYFGKLSHAPDQAFWIPAGTLLKLSQSLKLGSYDVTAQIIHASVRDMQSAELSALLKRCMSFDLLNTILKTASELGYHRMAQEISPNAMLHPSPEQLERALLHLASQICSQVEKHHQKEEQTVIDRIAAYIDANYADMNLSLESVALEFGISPSHVSRSFKEKRGVNFVHYVWHKRMEQVKHRLETTSEPLKDIIVKVGYVDTPNFIRKFKKETGLTPGQYRKQFAPPGSVHADCEAEEA